MSVELDLIRRFRAEDAAVDAASADAARSQLLAHIAATEHGEHGAGRAGRSLRRPGFTVRIRAELLAVALAVLVVIAVGAVFLGVGGRRAEQHPAHHTIPRTTRSGVLRNVAPESLPSLPGQVVCNADLAPPDAIPGLGGPRTGVIVVTATVVKGVNESPFSITARGLAPTARGDQYAVWILPAVSTTSGGYVLANGAKPRLLGVIVPGVGREGKLAVAGLLPSDVNGSYVVRITLRSHATTAKPGRTVLEGFAAL